MSSTRRYAFAAMPSLSSTLSVVIVPPQPDMRVHIAMTSVMMVKKQKPQTPASCASLLPRHAMRASSATAKFAASGKVLDSEPSRQQLKDDNAKTSSFDGASRKAKAPARADKRSRKSSDIGGPRSDELFFCSAGCAVASTQGERPRAHRGGALLRARPRGASKHLNTPPTRERAAGERPEMMLLLAYADWRDAVRVVARQRRNAASVADVVPAYRTAIRACGEAGRWQSSLDLLRRLREEGSRYESGCYAEAMKACRKNGQWRVALQLHKELREHAPPDMFTTSNAIAACEPAGQWRRALAILREQPDANAICVNAAISTCAKAGRWREALELLEQLEAALPPPEASAEGRERRRRPGDWKRRALGPTVRSYTAAMTACTRGGEWQRALQLWERMEVHRLHPDGAAYNAAVAACVVSAVCFCRFRACASDSSWLATSLPYLATAAPLNLYAAACVLDRIA